MNNTLIQQIKTAQNQQNISDVILCRLLEIDRSTWSKIKSGKRNPGGKFLRAIAQNFPELHPVLLSYMEGNPTTPSQTAQNKILRAFRGFFNKIARAIEDTTIPK